MLLTSNCATPALCCKETATVMADALVGEDAIAGVNVLGTAAEGTLGAAKAETWALNTNSLTVTGNDDSGNGTLGWLATLSKATSAVGPSAIRAGYDILLSSPLPVAVAGRIDDKLSDVMESALIWFIFVAYQRLCQGSNSRN